MLRARALGFVAAAALGACSSKGSYCNAGADYPPCLYSFDLPLQ